MTDWTSICLRFYLPKKNVPRPYAKVLGLGEALEEGVIQPGTRRSERQALQAHNWAETSAANRAYKAASRWVFQVRITARKQGGFNAALTAETEAVLEMVAARLQKRKAAFTRNNGHLQLRVHADEWPLAMREIRGRFMTFAPTMFWEHKFRVGGQEVVVFWSDDLHKRDECALACLTEQTLQPQQTGQIAAYRQALLDTELCRDVLPTPVDGWLWFAITLYEEILRETADAAYFLAGLYPFTPPTAERHLRVVK